MIRTENKKIWTHLSAQILSSQVSLGKTDPGSVKRIIEKRNQSIAAIRNFFTLFKGKNFYKITRFFPVLKYERAPN